MVFPRHFLLAWALAAGLLVSPAAPRVALACQKASPNDPGYHTIQQSVCDSAYQTSCCTQGCSSLGTVSVNGTVNAPWGVVNVGVQYSGQLACTQFNTNSQQWPFCRQKLRQGGYVPTCRENGAGCGYWSVNIGACPGTPIIPKAELGWLTTCQTS